MYHFYQQDPPNCKNSIQFVTKFMNFSPKNTSHIKYNNYYLLYELSHYMFKISIVGWHTCLQSVAVVFHSVVNGFLRQGRPNQLKCICKLGIWELFLALIAVCNKTLAFPSSLQWTEVGWIGDHSLVAMKSRRFDLMKLETENVKNDGYSWKINAILLNIKINRPKLVYVCRLIYWQYTKNSWRYT